MIKVGDNEIEIEVNGNGGYPMGYMGGYAHPGYAPGYYDPRAGVSTGAAVAVGAVGGYTVAKVGEVTSDIKHGITNMKIDMDDAKEEARFAATNAHIAAIDAKTERRFQEVEDNAFRRKVECNFDKLEKDIHNNTLLVGAVEATVIADGIKTRKHIDEKFCELEDRRKNEKIAEQALLIAELQEDKKCRESEVRIINTVIGSFNGGRNGNGNIIGND